MGTLRPALLALASAALLVGCAHTAPPNEPSVPPSSPRSPGDTAPGSIPGRAPGAPAEAPPPPSGPPQSPVSDYREVIKLYQANLSEDFIIRTIRQERRVYRLNADDVIELRNAGVGERVIQAMLDSGRGLAVAPERPVPEDRLTVLPRAGITGTENGEEMRWEGLARRQDGPVLFHDRWHPGTLVVGGDEIRWIDARDSTRNLLIPRNAVAEQFTTCLKKAGGNECFEWGLRTSSGETYRFRDVAWRQGEDDRPLSVHEFFRSRFPDLVDSQVPVDEKEK